MGSLRTRASLARFPLERNRSSDKKSRQIDILERILIAKVSQLLRKFVQGRVEGWRMSAQQ
jgi:hypothetical protein